MLGLLTSEVYKSQPEPMRYAGMTMCGIFLLGLLVLDGLIFFLAFRPAGQSFAQQRVELEKLNNEAKGKRETVARLKKVEANLAESMRQAEEFSKIIKVTAEVYGHR